MKLNYQAMASLNKIARLTDDEERKRMKGTIRPTSRFTKCSKCHQLFLHIFRIGYFCPICNNKPERFCIDLQLDGHRYRICSCQGKALDNYGKTFDLLSIIQGEIDNGTFDPSKYVATEAKKCYASTLLDVFLKDKLRVTAPSYHSGYQRQVQLAKQHFCNTHVREIKKKDSIEYLKFLKTQKKRDGAPLRAKTILNYFGNFKTFLNYLKRQEIITALPEFPAKEEVDELMEEIILNERPFHYVWFKPEDQMSILDAIEGNEDREIVRFLMLHGCRPGEARALRVADVNIETLSITIKSTYSKNTLRSRRKGKKSKPYSIALHPEMVDFFKKRVKNHPEAFIFVNPKTGGPYMIDAFQNIFVSVRSKLNIPQEVRLYDASRHSFVTQLRRAGLPVGEISKLVGHSSEKMTERVYNHADDVEIENKRIAISKLSLRKPTEIVDIRAIS